MKHHGQAKSMVEVIQKACNSCTTIKATIKKEASNGHGQKAQDRKQATNFLQQAVWRLCHKGVDIAGKLTFCTASPSGLGQQGHKTLRVSCICQSSHSGLSQQGHETSQAS
jgi:hypothetical protein